MRCAFVYPPDIRDGKRPLLGQNRQFKYTHSREIRIYPLIPAHTVTNLKHSGHEVLFLDGINRNMPQEKFLETLEKFRTDMLIMETKAPIIRKHWAFINEFKEKFPETITVLAGDHVSFFPEESLENSSVDYVVTGGDYDISIPKIALRVRICDFHYFKDKKTWG